MLLKDFQVAEGRLTLTLKEVTTSILDFLTFMLGFIKQRKGPLGDVCYCSKS